MSIDGILNVNKPLGWTSLDVVRFVRRYTGVRRAGHAGTLDPAAEGVLPVCLGQATRLVEYIVSAPKVYRAKVRLGVSTDTYDGEGRVVREADPSGATRQAVEEALASFKGTIKQIPPMFSALKKDGVALYKYARAGVNVERESREVEVYRLELLEFAPPSLTVDVECGRGFYVRSFADDLGEQLGCGGHLEHLVRTRMGTFTVESAVDVDGLRQAFAEGNWGELLLPVDVVLLDRCALILGKDSEESASQGQTLRLAPLDRDRIDALAPGTMCRGYSLEGTMFTLLKYEGEGLYWHPEKVLRSKS